MLKALPAISLCLVAADPQPPPSAATLPGLLPPVHSRTDPKGAQGLLPGFFSIERPRSPDTLENLEDEQVMAALSGAQWTQAITADDAPLLPRCPFEHAAVRVLVGRGRRAEQDRARIVAELRRGRRSWLDEMLLHPLGNKDGRPQPSTAARSFNVAVALAYLGDPVDLVELDRKLRDESAPLRERTAAAYALAEFPERLAPGSLETLLSSLLPERSGLPGGNENEPLAVGVLWAWVRTQRSMPGGDPATSPVLAAAIEKGGPAARRVAAIAFADRAWHRSPERLARLLDDPDPKVRQTALAAAAAHPTRAVHERVLFAIDDGDLQVRLTAIDLLGRFPGGLSAERLRARMLADSPRERAAAVRSAARIGLEDVLYLGIEDKSDVVRRAAIEALGDQPGEAARKAIVAALGDRSMGVQEAVVDALERRPIAEAVPGLFEALASPSLATRQRAVEALARRWPAAKSFPVLERAPAREERLAALRDQWRREGENIAEQENARRAAAAPLDPRSAGLDPDRVAALVLDWHRGGERRTDAEKQLLALGPAALPTVEDVLLRRGSYPTTEFIASVLAPQEPIYRRISELSRSASVADRSGNAAGRETASLAALKQELKHRQLTEAQAVALAEYLRTQTSSAPWLMLAPILERDHPREARRLDPTGLAHPEMLVRQTTCERIAARVETDPSAAIVRLFDDPHVTVRRAALRAAGKLRRDPPIEELRRRLTAADGRERLAAAASLGRLAVSEGWEEVRRMAFDPDPQLRRAALDEAVAGAAPSAREAARLLTQALADEKIEVRQHAVDALETLTAMRFSVDRNGRPVPLEQQIVKWKTSLEADFTGESSETLQRRLGN